MRLVLNTVLSTMMFLILACRDEKNLNKPNGPWLSLEEAYQKSTIDQVPIFLDVWAEWCHPCKIMDKNIYQDKEMLKKLQGSFHLAKLNVDQTDEILCNQKRTTPYKCLELEWKQPGLPFTGVLNSKGELIHGQMGEMNTVEFNLFLHEYHSTLAH